MGREGQALERAFGHALAHLEALESRPVEARASLAASEEHGGGMVGVLPAEKIAETAKAMAATAGFETITFHFSPVRLRRSCCTSRNITPAEA